MVLPSVQMPICSGCSLNPNTTFDAYNAVNAGVDMRNISTDNIESVEIIRGIPSVEYNDLTSGVVIIKQKQKATPVEARIKADQYGKLFSIGKGVEWKDQRTVLSADAGFLDSYNDPRDRLNNFKRINASVRLNKKWLLGNEHRLNWTAGISYSGNIDNVKNRPGHTNTTRRQLQIELSLRPMEQFVKLDCPTGQSIQRGDTGSVCQHVVG